MEVTKCSSRYYLVELLIGVASIFKQNWLLEEKTQEAADDDVSLAHVIYIWVQAVNAYSEVVQQATQKTRYSSACVVIKMTQFLRRIEDLLSIIGKQWHRQGSTSPGTFIIP
jgi:hypothetical protein